MVHNELLLLLLFCFILKLWPEALRLCHGWLDATGPASVSPEWSGQIFVRQAALFNPHLEAGAVERDPLPPSAGAGHRPDRRLDIFLLEVPELAVDGGRWHFGRKVKWQPLPAPGDSRATVRYSFPTWKRNGCLLVLANSHGESPLTRLSLKCKVD